MAMKESISKTGKQPVACTLSKIYKARKKGRKHSGLDYPMGACKWCIAWGWLPKDSLHSDKVCIYVPDGPLHKKVGGTYEQMYSSKLTTRFYQLRKELFEERRKAREKKGNKSKKDVRFTGEFQRVPDEYSNLKV